jgi:hypothetical protein
MMREAQKYRKKISTLVKKKGCNRKKKSIGKEGVIKHVYGSLSYHFPCAFFKLRLLSIPSTRDIFILI